MAQISAGLLYFVRFMITILWIVKCLLAKRLNLFRQVWRNHRCGYSLCFCRLWLLFIFLCILEQVFSLQFRIFVAVIHLLDFFQCIQPLFKEGILFFLICDVPFNHLFYSLLLYLGINVLACSLSNHFPEDWMHDWDSNNGTHHLELM